MSRIELTQSPVVFSEYPHGYRLGEKRMSGITSLIHQVLQLGVYPEAGEFVRNVAIPRAGEYGTAVHHAIETYDNLGIKVTAHPKSERFQNGNDDQFWDVSDELETYIRHREGYEPVANEYTVSDDLRYASNIDNVWLKSETQGIWLVDTKTNNLSYYPGGEDALQEYLSWQLSVYAYLFERQNPSLKVEGLACNWLRHSEGAFWMIERKPDTHVELLLSVPWIYTDNGFVYDGQEVAKILQGETALVAAPYQQLIPQETVQMIYRITMQADEAKKVLEEMKTRLREAMDKNSVKSWDSGLFKATIANDSTSETFDTARFKNEHPDLYKEYLKQTVRKGGFTIKLRN
ncbi:MAG: PD-(D/E)XK nuclease family protein [Muribaculaceae bacterium]|nr:PD-(D/E)XK nuclease family protein [Muribaculaceae bacterium]